ncbi:MAG: DNA primase [Candidatus Electronema aureum]|uniref:DNA primase n=1 Tax=Candidatus Electronema aureum TaxID=2005002 RepID=A0A521G1G7_9BACT|nr:MAG: DNA primase [Candidatus Electronema aureum]
MIDIQSFVVYDLTSALNNVPDWQNLVGKIMTFSDSWDEAINRVREAADIVQIIGEHVQLKRAGNRFSGLCPFHGEKTPSFSVNPQGQFQFFKCFGCGESGDVFDFLMKYQNLSFPEALKDLARRYQISLPERKLNEAEQERRRQRELLHQVNEAAAQLFHEYLLKAPQAEAARQYLRQRGVPPDFVEQYQLGYAPAQWDFITSQLIVKFPAELVEQSGLIVRKDKNRWYDRFRDRVMFPILDLSGKTAAFGGRILGEGQPKYMNSPESLIFEKSRILFGLHQHREAIRKSRRAIVVEGNFDLLLLAVHGISNAVAPLGTALTKEHVRTLRSYCSEVVLLFDGDSAGLKAARRSIPFFLNEQLEAKVALLPQGHDPDSLVREKGAAGIQELVNTAAPLPEFVFSALAQEHGLTLSGKSKIMAELTDLVKQSPDQAQRELIAAHFGSKLGVSLGQLLPGTPLPQAKAEVQELPPLPEDMPVFDHEPIHETFVPLPPKQQRLLSFLVLYPEHFNELIQGGLLDYVRGCVPTVQTVVAAMQQLTAEGSFMPELLLSVLSGSQERQHVADLLRQGSDDVAGNDEEQGQALCGELLAWLRKAQKQQDGAELQQLLQRAIQNGDDGLIQELLQKIYIIRSEK